MIVKNFGWLELEPYCNSFYTNSPLTAANSLIVTEFFELKYTVGFMSPSHMVCKAIGSNR